MKHLTTKTVHFLKVTFYGLVLAAVSFACSADTFTTAVDFKDKLPPVVKFIDDVSQDAVPFDDIIIQATDENRLKDGSLKYAFSADAVCDASDSYNQSYQSDVKFVINSNTNTGKYICAKAEDLSGNITYVASKEKLNIDTSVPKIKFLTNVPVGPVKKATFKVEVTVEAPGTLDPNSLKFAFAPSSTSEGTDGCKALPAADYTQTYPNNADKDIDDEAKNDKFICVMAKNMAGLTFWLRSDNLLNIDKTAPTIALVGPSTTWATSDVVKITVSDTPKAGANLETSNYKYAIVTGAADCKAGVTLTPFSSLPSIVTEQFSQSFNTENNNGKYICAYAKDKAGNETYVASANTFHIDTTPPAITFADDVSAEAVQINKVKVKVTDPTLNAASVKYVLTTGVCNANIAGLTAYTSEQVLTFNTEADTGKYVCIVAADTLGHSSTAKSTNPLNIDTTKPKAILANLPFVAYDNAEVMNVEVKASDAQKDSNNVKRSNITAYKYKQGLSTAIDCSVAAGYSAETPIATRITDNVSADKEKERTLCVVAKDSAGNWQDFAVATKHKWTVSDKLYAYVEQGGTYQESPFPFQKDPVNKLPISFDVIFTSPIKVADFTVSDVIQQGTATGVVWEITNSGDDRKFKLTAKNLPTTSTGTLIPFIPAGSVEKQNEAGKLNMASISIDNIVTYTKVQPTVQISLTTGAKNPTNDLTLSTFKVLFSLAMDLSTLEASDFTNGGTAAGVTFTLKNETETYPEAHYLKDRWFTLTAKTTTSTSADGDTIIPKIDAGKAFSTAENPNKASKYVGKALTYDDQPPTAELTGAPPATPNINMPQLNVSVGGPGVDMYIHTLVSGDDSVCAGATYGSPKSATDDWISDDLDAKPSGTYTLCVKGIDKAGNIQEVPSHKTFTLDKTLPMAIAKTGLPTGTSKETNLNIQVAVKDNTGELTGAEYAYKIIAGSSSGCSGIGGYQPVLTESGGVIPSATSGTLTTVNITKDITSLDDGQITLCLLGKRTTGTVLWQTMPSVSAYSWSKNTAVPKIEVAETVDLDGNGKLDHYRLEFDIKVKDSTFPGYKAAGVEGDPTTLWQVGANANVYKNERIDLAYAGDIANDKVIYLKFDERAEGCGIVAGVIDQKGCDTGIKPDITSTNPGITSIAGVPMLPIPYTSSVTEKDTARPVMVAAHAFSHLTLTAVFSEDIQGLSAECGLGSKRPNTPCTDAFNVSNSSVATGALTLYKGVMANGQYKDNRMVFKTSFQEKDRAYKLRLEANMVKDMSYIAADEKTVDFKGSEPKLVLLSAKGISNTKVEAEFNEAPNSGHLLATNYTVPGLKISAAEVVTGAGTNGETIRLTTSRQFSDTINGYKLTVNGVSSPSGTIASPNNIAYFTGDKLPAVAAASSINETTIYVTFSKNMNFETDPSKPEYAKSALNAGNYCIQVGNQTGACNQLGTVTAASVSANSVVKLTTATQQTTGKLYFVTVTNAQDTNGNDLDAADNYRTFIGNEGLKILFAKSVPGSSEDMSIFKVSFSKPYMCTATPDGGVNKCNDTSVGANDANNFKNWGFPFKNPQDGMYSMVSLCKNSDDTACPPDYVKEVDNVLFFKLDHNPTMGAFTVVGASMPGQMIVAPQGQKPVPQSFPLPPFKLDPVAGCIKDAWDKGCLLKQPDDRATFDWILPTDVNDGPVYDDPFNDGKTQIGQVLKYNGKLLIGPNSVNSGLFSTDYSLSNSQNILLDSEVSVEGIQPFMGEKESAGSNQLLQGIDYMYAACYGVTQDKTTLSGVDCTAAGGTEYLFIVGFINTTPQEAFDKGYQSVWITKDKVSPFRFEHLTGLSSYGTLTYRAMNVYLYKNYVFQAQQHQFGGHAPRASSYNLSGGTWKCFPNPSGNGMGACDLDWPSIPRIGTKRDVGKTNGQLITKDLVHPTQTTFKQGLVSVDSMLAYKANGIDHLYMANGGSCPSDSLTNRWRDYKAMNGYENYGVNGVDGGIVRSTDPNSATGWEDVTPGANLGNRVSAVEGTPAGIWNSFMSKALPQDARVGKDWKYLVPENKITPSIKAIPKMVEFNGDLYVIRNACADTTVKTLSVGVTDTCPVGSERPQLWRLPKGCTSATDCASKWKFIGDTTNPNSAIKYTTRMGGAVWTDGAEQATKTANNQYITILEKVGDRLYVGFDNSENGINLWRTKTGVTAPTKESDFEAICQTGNACFNPTKQFGLTDSTSTTDTKFFDSVAVNDAGKDYIILNARNGSDVLRIYRQSNE